MLDAKTGETKWKVDRDENTGWATPLVVEHDGRTQVIVNATKRVRSYDLQDRRSDLGVRRPGAGRDPLPGELTVNWLSR